jgi:hypothetical protein
VLSTIHPEHIEEMNYAGCNDFTVDATRARNAVFVTLKPGVAFEPGRGSFVVDAKSYTASEYGVAPMESTPAPSIVPAPAPSLAPYRARLLGVFDALTGDAVVGADVVDVATGTFASTTSTGTVSLAFLPEGSSTIRIRKPGYAEVSMDVSISPRDTVPLTIVIGKP